MKIKKLLLATVTGIGITAAAIFAVTKVIEKQAEERRSLTYDYVIEVLRWENPTYSDFIEFVNKQDKDLFKIRVNSSYTEVVCYIKRADPPMDEILSKKLFDEISLKLNLFSTESTFRALDESTSIFAGQLDEAQKQAAQQRMEEYQKFGDLEDDDINQIFILIVQAIAAHNC